MTEREKMEKKANEWIEEAKRCGKPVGTPRNAIQNGSSLHKIIKTPEQAARFMKALKAAEAE